MLNKLKKNDLLQTNDSHPVTLPIPRYKNLSYDDFKKNFYDKSVPVIIESGCKNLVDNDKFTFEYFRNTMGEKELSYDDNSYNGLNVTKRTSKVKVGHYIDQLIERGEEKMTESNYKYLSLIPIFRYLPDLKKDIDFSFFKMKSVFFAFGWLGPKGSFVDFHSDRIGDNLFLQVKGEKLWRIVPYKYEDCMYVTSKYEIATNFSAVNYYKFLEDPSQWPNFSQVVMYEGIVGPGDVLFNPLRNYHSVESLTPSISINAFATTYFECFVQCAQEFIRLSAHHIGLFRNDNCLCCKHKKTILNFWYYLPSTLYSMWNDDY